MDGIKDLGSNVYIAEGRVIAVFDDTFDASDPASREKLLDLGRNSYKEHWDRAPHGFFTVRTVSREGLDPLGSGKPKRALGSMHMSELPEGVKEKLRKEFPEHAAEI